MYCVLLIFILLILYCYRYERISDPKYPFTWTLAAGHHNTKEAAALLSATNNKIITLLRYMKYKYNITGYDHHTTRSSKCAEAVLRNYNFEKIRENDPIYGSGTSYTIDKGKHIYICLRSKLPPYELVDINTMTFVLMHEISHIANYDGWGHENDFWSVFKFVLSNAIECNIYKPIDYAKTPVKYCGIDINYQPLYDASIPNIDLQ